MDEKIDFKNNDAGCLGNSPPKLIELYVCIFVMFLLCYIFVFICFCVYIGYIYINFDRYKLYFIESKYEIFRNIDKSLKLIDIEKLSYYLTKLNSLTGLSYELTKNERGKIAKYCIDVLFNLEYKLSHSFQIVLLQVLRKMLLRKDLSLIGFEIDWKPFYELLLSVHFHQNGCIPQDSSNVLSTHASQLNDTIKIVRHYFKKGSINEILNELLPYLNPFDIKYSTAILCIDLFLPTQQIWVKDELLNYKIKNCINKHGLKSDFIALILHQIINETQNIYYPRRIFLRLLSRIIKHNPNIDDLTPFWPDLFHILRNVYLLYIYIRVYITIFIVYL